MNILIVDDEMLVRLGMKTIFYNSHRNYHVIEACDGKQALELYMRYKPLLVFVDISMPLMDGLEFISSAKKAGFITKFIILTCHDEIELVRKAIKLGVSDYILKNAIVDSEVLALADEVAKEIKDPNLDLNSGAEDDHLEHIKENVIKNIMRNDTYDSKLIEELAIKYDISFLKNRFAVMLLHSKKLQSSVKAMMANIIKQLMEEYLGGYLLEMENGLLLVFLTLDDSPGEGDFIEEFCSRVMKSMILYFNINVSIGVCICDNATKIASCKEKAKIALQNRFYNKQPGLFLYNSEKKNVVDIRKMEFYRDEIARLLSMMDYSKAANVFEEMVSFLVTSKPWNIVDVYNTYVQLHYIFVQHAAQHFKTEDAADDCLRSLNALEEYNNIFEIIKDFQDILLKMQTVFSRERQKYHERIIHKAKAFIMDHLMENTDLDTVARHVSLSPTYFSELFKEVTGEKFIDYVINFKINKAKEYISKGEKVYSVMEKLGYNNYSYFCRLFKRVTGKSLKKFK